MENVMNQCTHSENTKTYLARYEEILSEMIGGMSAAEQTESISSNFIAQMIPHHRAAIAMSENLLRYTTDLPLQGIAQNIISEQKKSIQNMLAVEPACRACLNPPRELAAYQEKNAEIMNWMFRAMRSVCAGNNLNVNFMREMIPHHEGAVRMSENALRYPLCPELVPLLNAIITSQKKGIREMQALLWRQIHCCP